MIDIHNHILPGMDDGAWDMDDAVEMAAIAVESGVTAIVATPHCNIPGSFENYFGEEYLECFKRTREVLKYEGIPLTLYPGMEVFATFDLPRLMVDGKIMTLNQSRYLLVEFAFYEEADFAEYLLEQVAELGAVPVIAHAERYFFIQENPQIAYDWVKKGYVIQANKSSFKGSFGAASRKMAFDLLDHQLISVIASDAHGVRERNPYMREAYEGLSWDYSKDYLNELFHKNPGNICKDLPLIRRTPKQFV
ncbi:MAG: tyrosine-protein phosphatase [Lachnospiraceae bacterium]